MTMVNGNGSDTVAETASTGTAAEPKPKTTKKKVKPAKRTVTQSTISFPYRDLEAGMSVALAIIGAGGVALTNEQLAGVMGLQAGSGNYVMKVSTARIFGLIANTGGKYELTDTGFAIVDKNEQRQKAAKATAFLTVPLYRRVYDEFKGRQLPPRPHALEQAFVRFGVSEKQKTAARQIFDKSAMQAGFFAAGNDRLIEPIISGTTRPVQQAEAMDLRDDSEQRPLSTVADQDSGRHPFIQGLLDTLPEPDTNWTVEGRAKWLMAAANIFDLIYKGTGEIQITPKPTPQKE